MSRTAQSFTQNDVSKAVKGAAKAGLSVRRVEVDRSGKIVIVIGDPERGPAGDLANPWDSVA